MNPSARRRRRLTGHVDLRRIIVSVRLIAFVALHDDSLRPHVAPEDE